MSRNKHGHRYDSEPTCSGSAHWATLVQREQEAAAVRRGVYAQWNHPFSDAIVLVRPSQAPPPVKRDRKLGRFARGLGSAFGLALIGAVSFFVAALSARHFGR